MATRTLDLTSASDTTDGIRVGDKKGISAVTLASVTYGTAVVEMQESNDDITWQTVSPVAEMAAATPQIFNRGIFGSMFVRFRVKTLDAGAGTGTITYELLG